MHFVKHQITASVTSCLQQLRRSRCAAWTAGCRCGDGSPHSDASARPNEVNPRQVLVRQRRTRFDTTAATTAAQAGRPRRHGDAMCCAVHLVQTRRTSEKGEPTPTPLRGEPSRPQTCEFARETAAVQGSKSESNTRDGPIIFASGRTPGARHVEHVRHLRQTHTTPTAPTQT